MRRFALAASLLIVAASSRAFAADCDACLPNKMCIRHQKEQDDLMKAEAKFLKDKDAMKRKAALEKLGQLNNEHMNSRSTKLAEAIADLLDDTDSGIRMSALTFMSTNQEAKTAKKEIGKMLNRLLPKVSKPQPSGKGSGVGNAAMEWDNQLALVKQCLPAMAQLGGPEPAEFFIDALKSDNLALAAFAVSHSVELKSKKLVDAYLDRMEHLLGGKSEDENLLCGEIAKAFSAQAVFAEPLGDNRTDWLKKAHKWWDEKKEAYDAPPPEAPKDGGDAK